jgi:hypothetical protein
MKVRDRSELAVDDMKLIKEFCRGQLSLPKSFWIGGVLLVAVLYVLGYFLASWCACSANHRLALTVAVSFGLLLVGYQLLASIGIWRASIRYEGLALWKWLARGAIVGTWLVTAIVGLSLGFAFSFFAGGDPTRNSFNVAKKLSRDPQYPLTGFWEPACDDHFGLAIERSAAEPGKYSVSFCGPGGCFPPGTYRANTKIFGDEAYHVVDENTIEVKGSEGFSPYVRCE